VGRRDGPKKGSLTAVAPGPCTRRDGPSFLAGAGATGARGAPRV